MSDRIAFAGPVSLEGRRIMGSVVLAGSRTFRNGEWLEVDPAAVVKADASDVIGRWEHDPSKVLGRSSNGTVRVSRTDQGIEYEIDVPDTSYGNDLLALMNRGDIRGSSFEIEGLRSSFSTDPDGTRVRRITSIQRLSDVSPVTDPAFVNSTAAAFSKESDVTDIIEEPVAAPAPKADAPAKFTAKDEKSDTYRTAEKFARDRESLAELAQAIDNLLAGEMTPAKAEAYDAFSAVYDERKRNADEARDRIERIKLAQDLRLGRGPKAPVQAGALESEDYKQAFSQYLRTGRHSLMEQFAQSIAGDGTQGGFMVPDGFLNRITERLVSYGGIAGQAETITTSTGESLRWPSNDDTSNSAAIATEGSAVGSGGADFVFGEITLGAFSYDATGTSNNPVKVSLELLQDAAFDVEAFVSRKLGERIGRKQAADLANGGGTTAPVGLLTKSADVMTATACSLAAVEHVFQVDAAYREMGNCRWVMSDTTLAKLWSSQSTTNEPLFIPGGADITGRPGPTLLGYPITIDAAAGNNVAFGDIRQGYIIRRVRGVQVLVDPYTAQSARQVAYHAWARMDANITDSYAYSVSSWSGVSADT